MWSKVKLTGCGPYILEEVTDEYCSLQALKITMVVYLYQEKIVINYRNDNDLEGFVDGKYDIITANSKDEFNKVKNMEKCKYLFGRCFRNFTIWDLIWKVISTFAKE